MTKQILSRKTIFAGLLVAIMMPLLALTPEQNTKFGSFPSVKKALYSIQNEKTFYCGCEFHDGKVNLDSCGYKVRKSETRAARIEAEHVVPASKMCGQTTAWTQGHPDCITGKGQRYKGRQCAEKVIPVCDRALNDLRNLRPAIGEINGDRSDLDFGEIPGEVRKYGTCDFETAEKIAEPADSIRGDIARIYLFMNITYPELQFLNEVEAGMFRQWSQDDPVSPEECKRNEEVAKLQGSPNTIVAELCAK